MSLLTGEIRKGVVLADRYRVLRPLGSGGMATVFLAEDEKLERPVAVKRLHTDAPKASLQRFRDEARLGAALNHPNLVAIYDTVAAEEGALIVMEYVPGQPLSELAGGRKMRPSRALPILRSVAEALDHAHAEGVVHRDVKPGNVVVGDDGTVKLADLGIARAIGASQITSEGSVVGTLPYMSPERLQGPGAGGPESDVYALAAVAYELLSGQPPSTAMSTEEAGAQAPLDLRRDWPGGPPAAIAVLERGLDDDPGRRQPSAGRLVQELEAGLERGAAGVPAPDAAATRVAPTGAPTRRAPADVLSARGRDGGARKPLAIGAVVLGLLAITGVALSSGGGDGGGASEAGAVADAKQKEAKPKETAEPAPAPAPAPEPASESLSAAELNDQGFALINEGLPDEAIPLLERVVAMYPDGSQDLTYAYALYNLGQALRLAGRPDEAIPVLEQRLQIPNQRGAVGRELEAAIAEAGGEAGFEGDGPGNGNGRGNDEDGGDD